VGKDGKKILHHQGENQNSHPFRAVRVQVIEHLGDTSSLFTTIIQLKTYLIGCVPMAWGVCSVYGLKKLEFCKDLDR
jgi:hypothetical protein